MPNVGRSSRGCYTCRARRIKCDRGEPGCRKCKTFGRPCPGYRDEVNLLFRDQNDYAKVKVMTRPSRALISVKAGKDQDSLTYLPIPQSLSLNFEAQCIDQFFSQYVMAEGRTGYGYFDFIPSISASADALPCLKSALPAVALANAAKQRNQLDLLWRARQKYGETLSLVKQTLRASPDLCAGDSLRLTILMLSLYELITGEGFMKNFWDSHHEGRLMILRRPTEHLRYNRPAWNLYRVTHTHLMTGCLLRRKCPPEDAITWLSMGHQNGLIEKTNPFFIRVIRVLAHTQDVARSWLEPMRSQKLREIMQHGTDLDRDITNFMRSLPSVWRYTSFPNNGTGTTLPKFIHVHEDLFTAGSWNAWRCMRIRLIQVLLAIAELVGEDSRDFNSQLMTWRRTLTDLADDVCSTTPFLLGEIDSQGVPRGTPKGVALGGYMLLYPLHIVLAVQELPESYHRFVESKLTYIAKTMGIEQASIILKASKMLKNFPVIGDIVLEAERFMPSLKGCQQAIEE